MADASVSFETSSSGNALADRRYDFALQLFSRGEADAAIDLLQQTADLVPLWPPVFFTLGDLFTKTGRTEDATIAYRRCLALDPQDRLGAAIKLALLGAVAVPETFSTAYVQSLFDDYAGRFDDALLNRLSYKAPALLRAAIDTIEPPAKRFAHILDLGCGTGLALAEFAGRYDRADGVDLSANMTSEARRKNLYTTLSVEDLSAFLQKAQSDHYDLILSADVFVYIGALDALFPHIARALQPDGLFAFSVQSMEGRSFALQPDHRFAHSHSYIQRCAKSCNLSLSFHEPAALRKDGARDVVGAIYVLQKPL